MIICPCKLYYITPQTILFNIYLWLHINIKYQYYAYWNECKIVKHKALFETWKYGTNILSYHRIHENIHPQDERKWFTAPYNTWIISCKVWNYPVVYPTWEYRFDLTESNGNILNPTFIKKFQGQKHPGRRIKITFSNCVVWN